MSEIDMVKKTLFAAESEIFSAESLAIGQPYYISLKHLADAENSEYDSVELSAFSQIMEHEIPFYESRGFIAGSIQLTIDGQHVDVSRQPLGIPGFVENENLELHKCTAKGVLVVENQKVFKTLYEGGFCQRCNYLLVTGTGIPRAGVRRLLHRFENELHLRVGLLADNDTWGYFLYSVLKRGLLVPHKTCNYLALSDLCYIGIRAGDAAALNAPSSMYRPWKSLWDKRLRAMRAYDCFESLDWVAEFDRFQSQGKAIDVSAIISLVGIQQFIKVYLEKRLE